MVTGICPQVPLLKPGRQKSKVAGEVSLQTIWGVLMHVLEATSQEAPLHLSPLRGHIVMDLHVADPEASTSQWDWEQGTLLFGHW